MLSDLYPFFMNTPTKVQTIHLETFKIFGKVIGILEFHVSGFKYEDLILLLLYRLMLNDKMLKPNLHKK